MTDSNVNYYELPQNRKSMTKFILFNLVIFKLRM